MGRLKTICVLILPMAGLIQPQGAAADGPALSTDMTDHFAICAGRLSALMQHQWLFDGPAADVTERDRDAMVAVLDAATHPGDGPRAMALRIEAKAVHAALLAQAVFGRDEAAQARANALVAGCTAMLAH